MWQKRIQGWDLKINRTFIFFNEKTALSGIDFLLLFCTFLSVLTIVQHLHGSRLLSYHPLLLLPSNTSFLSPLHHRLSSLLCHHLPSPSFKILTFQPFSINGLTSVNLIFTTIRAVLFVFIFCSIHFQSLSQFISWHFLLQWLEERVWRRWRYYNGKVATMMIHVVSTAAMDDGGGEGKRGGDVEEEGSDNIVWEKKRSFFLLN